MKSQEEEISKERWEEAMSDVLGSQEEPTNNLFPAHPFAGMMVGVQKVLVPSPTSPSPIHSLASDLWACLLLLPRLMRWAIAEAARISRELGNRP